MYLSHFNISAEPFGLTPNTAFYFEGRSHKSAVDTLLLSLKAGEGFIKIVGEVGTGKTLLCRALIKKIGPEFKVLYVPNPALSKRELFHSVLKELNANSPALERNTDLIDAINAELFEYHRVGKRVVLLVDEAQALPSDSLEAVRLLTNLETEQKKLLQVVLFGQPELDVILSDPAFRQLRQRILFHEKLEPFSKDETLAYIRHRLSLSGLSHTNVFSKQAMELIYDASGGVARLVHVLAHKAMLVAYGKGSRYITQEHVHKAILDTQGTVPNIVLQQKAPVKKVYWEAVAAAGILLLVGGVLFKTTL